MTNTHPRALRDIVGRDAELADFSGALAAGRLAHGWLLTGPEGVGKRTLAYQLARQLLARNAAMASQFAAGTHPDMLVIGDEEEPTATIAVEEVRRIHPFTQLTAAYDGWRIVLVINSHRLGRAGQNAILKILEEPPPRTLLLLTSLTAGRLLPTIRSRCRLLRVLPLSDEDMTPLLRAHGVDDLERPALLTMAAGCVGLALRLKAGDGGGLRQQIATILQTRGTQRLVMAHAMAEQMAGRDNELQFRLACDQLLALLYERVRQQVAVSGDGLRLAVAIYDGVRALIQQQQGSSLDRRACWLRMLEIADETGTVGA